MPNLRLRVRHAGRLTNICGIEVESIEQSAIVSTVPGSEFHMALVRGQILPVLKLGDADGCLVVGRVGAEVIGVSGLDIVGFVVEESDTSYARSPISGNALPNAETSASPSQPNCELEVELDIATLIATARRGSRRSSQMQEAP